MSVKHRENKAIPLGTNILVDQHQRDEVTEGGIFIPEVVGGKLLNEGTVVAAGKDVKNVKAGDTVLFADFVGYLIQVGGRTYRAMDEDEVFGCLVPAGKEGK